MNLSDRDILFDVLVDTKSISTGYHVAVLESANDRVRNTLIQINNDEINAQKQIFDLMHSRGWYPVEPAQVSATMETSMTTAMGANMGTMSGMGRPMGTTMETGMGTPPVDPRAMNMNTANMNYNRYA